MPYTRRPLPKRDAALSRLTERGLRAIDPSAGRFDAILPAPLLQKKLGKTTYRVWCTLLTMRNEKGESHPSMPGLARASYISEAQLQKSLGRLRDFKLVEDLGFMFREVPCKCDVDYAHEHKVYMRRIFGALQATPDRMSQVALVPRETAALVKAAAGQGGARAGAGRPKGAKDTSPRKEPVRIIKHPSKESNIRPYKYLKELFIRDSNESLKKARDFAPRVFLSTSAEETMPNPSQPSAPAPSAPAFPAPDVSVQPDPAPALAGQTGSGAVSSPSEALTQHSTAQHAARAPQRASVAAQAAPDESVIHSVPDDLEGEVEAQESKKVDLLELYGDFIKETPLGLQMGGGGASRPQQRYTPADMGAASTLTNQIQTLRAPAPPRVKPEMGEGERLALLRAAYRAAHEKVYKQEYFRKGKSGPTEAERKQMLEATEALIAEGISPLSWAVFSFYQWRKLGKTTSPTQKWVWSHTRIHEHAGWCHEDTGSQNTGKPYYQPATRELMLRHNKIRQALGWGRPTDEVVSEILPDEERVRLLKEQEQQNRRGMELLEAAIRNGEWVW